MRKEQLITLKVNTVKSWKAKMRNKNINISELAKVARVSRATIHNALKGCNIPNLNTINKIEEALNN
jgi:DNA-binding phage protein